MLYIGFVSATIPFAFGIGALASGRLDDLWIGSVRVWMLISFLFLSVGLILGGRWACEELGWGGHWAWDPVENAGFMPWFTATAFLHSAIIQEQRGMMKTWNLAMVVVRFFLTIFKHANASAARVRLRLEPNRFMLEIEDNGLGPAGMDAPAAESRNGLRNMLKRMEDVGGQFTLGPAGGSGPKVCLSAPIRKE